LYLNLKKRNLFSELPFQVSTLNSNKDFTFVEIFYKNDFTRIIKAGFFV
jgi:hypothetical protein